jgi:uncharacterized YccA/Bax inhibitor family protein
MFRSSPFMRDSKYNQPLDAPLSAQESNMTIAGAVNKSFLLTFLLLTTGFIGFIMPNMAFLAGGGIIGFIVVLVASFKPQWSPVLAPTYAIFKGLAVGVVSAIYGGMYAGIVFNALTSTIGVLAAMLFIYKTGIIPVTDKFRSGLAMATMGIFVIYLLNIVLGFFGIQLPMLHQGGWFSILFSVGVIVVATLNLLTDFDTIERGAAHGAPKYMEWYSAMGLLVTLVWLYLEILRFLAMLAKER